MQTNYSDRMRKQREYELSFEPKSIWNYVYNNTLEELCDTNYKKNQLRKAGDDWVKAGAAGYLSSWNKEYLKRIIEFWTAPYDLILDPFAGHSSAFIPYLLKRNFIGFEITKERYEIQKAHLEKLMQLYPNNSQINLINDSSENLLNYVTPKTVDCVITDPPFWNLEKYGSAVNGVQLSDLKFDAFHDKLKQIFLDAYKVLKEGKFFIVKVANFRRNKKFIALKDKWAQILTDIGLEQHDEIVLELPPSKRHPLYIQAITNLNMLKVHEYLLVFRKGSEDTNVNDHINHNRPLVTNIYAEKYDSLFWSAKKGKIDWITSLFKEKKKEPTLNKGFFNNLNT